MTRTPNPVIIALDLETTGHLSQASSRVQDQPGITQIGAARVEYVHDVADYPDGASADASRWVVTDRFNTYVDPELDNPERWSPEAIEKTGIGPDTVKDAPNFLMAHTDFANFCVGATHMLTYNGEYFDYVVLKYQLERYGLSQFFPYPPCHIDLMKHGATWYEKAGKRGEKRPTLEELYEVVMGRTFENAHDAQADIDATVEIFIAKGGLQGLGYL